MRRRGVVDAMVTGRVDRDNANRFFIQVMAPSLACGSFDSAVEAWALEGFVQVRRDDFWLQRYWMEVFATGSPVHGPCSCRPGKPLSLPLPLPLLGNC